MVRGVRNPVRVVLAIATSERCDRGAPDQLVRTGSACSCAHGCPYLRMDRRELLKKRIACQIVKFVVFTQLFKGLHVLATLWPCESASAHLGTLLPAGPWEAYCQHPPLFLPKKSTSDTSSYETLRT